MTKPIVDSLSWVIVKNKECFKITFSGLLTNKEALRIGDEWRAMFELQKAKKFTIIFDCKEMKDYEPAARFTWQKVISDLKTQIGSIWVISDNKLIIAGAKIMGIFTSFTIKTASSQDKIEF